MTKPLTDTRPIRLKGRSFLTLVLSPEMPFHDWLARLDDLSARSAGFFLRKPIILDVEGLDVDRAGLEGMIEALGQRNVRIMGIEGARHSALAPHLPPAIAGGRPAPEFEKETEEEASAHVAGGGKAKPAAAAEKSEPRPARAMPSVIIEEPVRSGQSLVFLERDVTILGSVASGAEIVAGGSIHIYGALRGRALAGATGNDSARIFCRKLEAELLAINGLYKTAEDIEPKFRGQAVQLRLEGKAIVTEKLI